MRARFQMDVRLVGAGVLAAVTALVVLMVTSPPERTSIVVAGSDLPAGVSLGELDLRTRRVENGAGLISADSVDRMSEHVLRSPLAVDSPIPRSLLIAPEDERGVDLVGLDLESAAAVHGRLTSGDLVDVYVVAEEAELIAESVAVVDVEVENTSLGLGRVRLIVAVDGDVGPSLIAASQLGTIHLVRRGS